MEDVAIKKLLMERSETALQEISNQYSNLYKSVIRQMLSNENDVEECANDVLLALWDSIPPNNPQNLGAYICTVARRVAINRLKYNKRKKRNSDYTVMLSELGDCVPDTDALETQEELAGIERILSDFIRGLDAKTRVLFVRRYIFLESVTELSQRYGIKEGTISTKLFRARKKLKAILRKEGIDI